MVVKEEKSIPFALYANSSRRILSAADDVIDVAVEVRRSTTLLSSEEEESEDAAQATSAREYIDLRCDMFAYLFKIIEDGHPLCAPYVKPTNGGPYMLLDVAFDAARTAASSAMGK